MIDLFSRLIPPCKSGPQYKEDDSDPGINIREFSSNISSMSLPRIDKIRSLFIKWNLNGFLYLIDNLQSRAKSDIIDLLEENLMLKGILSRQMYDLIYDNGEIFFQGRKARSVFGMREIGTHCSNYTDSKDVCERCPTVDGMSHNNGDIVNARGLFNGRFYDIEHHYTGFFCEGRQIILQTYRDITELIDAQKKLKLAHEEGIERLQFSDQMTNLLAEADKDNYHEKINLFLSRVGEFYGSNQVRIDMDESNWSYQSKKYCWHREGTELKDCDNDISLPVKSEGGLIGSFVICQSDDIDAKKFILADQFSKSLENVFKRIESYEKLSKALEENKKLSRTDALTGIPNRMAVDRFLEHAWKRSLRSGSKIAIMMIDIDHFKQFNDTYGHPEGDVCLKMVAEALSESFVRGGGEMVARYGGEEFIVVMTDSIVKKGEDFESIAIASANRALENIRKLRIPHRHTTVRVNGEKIVTVSAGLKIGTASKESSHGLFMSEADEALYDVKHNQGRNKLEKV